MITFPVNASCEEVYPIAESWISAIASGNFDAACDMLFDDGRFGAWSLDRINTDAAVNAADPDFPAWVGPDFAITQPADAQVAERFDIPELNKPTPLMSYWMIGMNPKLAEDHPNCIGDLLYPLPINGYWSDVDTSFLIRKIDENSAALQLKEILAIRND